jgi:hypothetical protein
LPRTADSAITPAASAGRATITIAANGSGGAIAVVRARFHIYIVNIPPTGDTVGTDTIFGGLYLGPAFKITILSLRDVTRVYRRVDCAIGRRNSAARFGPGHDPVGHNY